jgi:hypothetical protein
MILDKLTDLNRYLTALPRRNPRLRTMIPTDVIVMINRGRSYVARSRALLVPVKHRSQYVNVFHCCVHKTGSQWIKSLLGDLTVYRYSGLVNHSYQDHLRGGFDPRPIVDRTFDRPFPARTVVTPLYVTYENYQRIPKRGPSRGFFVMRDPRDLVVSWYFSAKISHIPMGGILRMRRELNALSKEDGLIYAIEHLQEYGQLVAMDSWAAAARRDPEVLVLRYEDIRNSDPTVFDRLFGALDIRMPPDVLADIVNAYSFERLAGRKGGGEDEKSHLRAGGASSWRKHFTDKVYARFVDITGDLTGRLGYPVG